MRLPWDHFELIIKKFMHDRKFAVLGCLSFEGRCRHVPSISAQVDNCLSSYLIEIQDPPDCIPDYTEEVQKKITRNVKMLDKANAQIQLIDKAPLLSTEDQMLELIAAFKGTADTDTVILDISAFPKRFFCFFLRRMLKQAFPSNLIITYTEPESYLAEDHAHLADDVQQPASLPGFSVQPDFEGQTIVISLGFEGFNLKSLLDMYGPDVAAIKILMSFPPDGHYFMRQWTVLKTELGGYDLSAITEITSALDAEQVYLTLTAWEQDSHGLILVPFGPKPHTLAMTLFALKHGLEMCYTQPKVYHPDYTRGIGNCWAYVVKWDGVPCYDRIVSVT